MARVDALFVITGQSSAGRFQAGIVAHDDQVAEVPEVVSYMKTWRQDRLTSFCQERGWDCRKVWSSDGSA